MEMELQNNPRPLIDFSPLAMSNWSNVKSNHRYFVEYTWCIKSFNFLHLLFISQYYFHNSYQLVLFLELFENLE